VCVIDTRLAERFFPKQDPIGQEIAMYRGYARIVGIVGAIRGTTLDQGSRSVVYYPIVQVPLFPQTALLVRSAASGGPLIREAVRRTNASVPVYDVRTMEDRIAESLGIRRVVAMLVCAFGVICLLLATVGLHGVVAQMVGERTQEIGLRMALGAHPRRIMGQFLRYGLLSGSIGVVIGLAASVYVQKWLTGLLYDVKPFDLPTFCSASIGVMLILMLAVFWPARRASRIDLQAVLRYE
jgi:ABC-type antimicrobial peptide transport system permease subunit